MSLVCEGRCVSVHSGMTPPSPTGMLRTCMACCLKWLQYQSGISCRTQHLGALVHSKQKEFCLAQLANCCCVHLCLFITDYYFKEVFPLAGFSGYCDRYGMLYNLWGFCWNNHYVNPSPPNSVPVSVTLELANGLDCSSLSTEEQLAIVETELLALQDALIAANPDLAGMQIMYVEESVTCSPGVSADTAGEGDSWEHCMMFA